jgi:predicted GTPase
MELVNLEPNNETNNANNNAILSEIDDKIAVYKDLLAKVIPFTKSDNILEKRAAYDLNILLKCGINILPTKSSNIQDIIKNRFGPDGITLPCKINTNNGQFQFFEPQTTQGKQTTQVMKSGENIMKKNLAQKFKDMGGSFG